MTRGVNRALTGFGIAARHMIRDGAGGVPARASAMG